MREVCFYSAEKPVSALRLMVAIATITRTRWGTYGNAHYVPPINPLNRIARRRLCRLRFRNYVHEVSIGLMGISFVNSIDRHETFRQNGKEEQNIFFKHLFRNVNCVKSNIEKEKLFSWLSILFFYLANKIFRRKNWEMELKISFLHFLVQHNILLRYLIYHVKYNKS